MTRRAIPLGWLLLAICVMAAASLLPAPAAARADPLALQSPGGIGVRLLEAPAATAEDPRARLYIVDHLAPGTVIERRVEVTNTTGAPAAIRMYAAGASIGDGTFVGDAGASPNELSTWNAVRPDSLDLDAGAHASVTVTITVPRDAAPGERYAVVWAEVRSGANVAYGAQHRSDHRDPPRGVRLHAHGRTRRCRRDRSVPQPQPGDGAHHHRRGRVGPRLEGVDR